MVTATCAYTAGPGSGPQSGMRLPTPALSLLCSQPLDFIREAKSIKATQAICGTADQANAYNTSNPHYTVGPLSWLLCFQSSLDDGLRTWASASPVGDLDQVLGS